MARFNVTDSNGDTNFIEADEAYVIANYESYTEVSFPNLEIVPENATSARAWRDQELKDTDWIAQTPDHPQRDDYLAYRVKLRDWPADSDNFPATRPTLS